MGDDTGGGIGEEEVWRGMGGENVSKEFLRLDTGELALELGLEGES